MKKIRITEAQFEKIQKSEMKKIRTIKVTESQLNKIQESLKVGDLEKNIDKNFDKEKVLKESIEFIDFGREVMQAINDLFNNPSQDGLSPFWVKLGVTKGELAQLLIGGGLVYTTTLLTGEVVYKIARKGFINALKRLYNVIIGRRYDMYNKGKVINKDIDEGDGGYPAGAEYASNAPWNQKNDNYESEPQSKHDYFQILKNFGDFAILTDPSGNKFFIDMANFYYDPKADDDFLSNKINVGVESRELKIDGDGTDLFGLNVISRITPENKDTFLDNTEDFPEVSELINDLSETTTTGSVGGSYETPFFLSKNPKKGRFFNKPMLKGGAMVKNKLSEDEKYRLERFAVEMDMYIFAKDVIEAQKITNQITKSINKKYDADARVTNLKVKSFGSLSEKSEVKDIAENYLKFFTKERHNYFDGDLNKILGLVESDLSNISKVLDENITKEIKESLIFLLHETNDSELIGLTSLINEDYGKVTFDDCVKLNNNKEAQNGGCSTGAIDDVVKIEKLDNE